MPRVPAQIEQPTRHSPATRTARILTEVFAPAVLAATMPMVIALYVTTSIAAGVGWGLLAVLFSSVIPYGIIWLGVRHGHLTDHHIGVRTQRRKPLIFGLASVLAGLLVLTVAGAPRQLVAMVVVMFVVLLVVTAINQRWKLSAHSAVAAGSVTVLVMVFGPALLVATLLVVSVGWSRVQLRDHTPSQVVAGAVSGAVLAAATFAPLR
jgi:membrane-associated phospholipid phosphatase